MKRAILAAIAAVLFSTAPYAAPRTDINRTSAGGGFTCAKTTSEGAVCWGTASFGRLGNGDGTNNQPSPVDVLGLTSGVSDVQAGGAHACALTTAGGVKCWGFNNFGQLGDGTTQSRFAPVDVVGLTSGVRSVSAGFNHTCALMNSGGVKCWGANVAGELGDGTTGVPRLVPVDVVGLTNASNVAAGNSFTCAVTPGSDSPRSVRCWGLNDRGQLGNGTFVNSSTPIEQRSPDTVNYVTAGDAHACSGDVSATVKCWGANEFGEIGDGTFQPRPTPFRLSLTTVFVISAGNGFTCASEVNQGLPCWGKNTSGELGDGTRISRPTPALVRGLPSDVSPFVLLSAGRDHACVAPQDGRAWCWGYDAQGAIGDGSFGFMKLLPSRVGVMQPQTVTFQPPGNLDIELGPVSLVASSSAGLPVFFASQTPSTCTVSGATLTPVAIGVCAIYATAPGDSTFATSEFVQQNALVFGSPAGSVSRLRGISTRASAGQGDDAIIGGFIIDGPGPKTVLVRAIGPSLSAQNVSNPVANPFLQLVSRNSVITNDQWQAGPSPNPDGDPFIGTDAQVVQSIGFNPSNPAESMVLMTLEPGGYTAIAYGADGGSGVALMEVIEIDRADAPLTGISTRGRVGTGEEVMIGGFIIEGSQPLKVAIRARGPSLMQSGVPGALANPVLTVVRGSDAVVIAVNDDWQTDANAGNLQASGYAPGDAAEAAVLMTLAPGAYTAIVTGAGGTTGIGIVEVFAVAGNAR
jgi:alpha-tubulin suppressor-like RCC1 family protein